MIRKNKHILSAICSAQWAMEPQYFELMLQIAQGYGDVDAAMIGKDNFDSTRTVLSAAAQGTDVAIIPVIGPIIPRASGFSRVCGITDLDALNSQFQAGMEDDRIGKVLFYFDTPGGHVTGINEFSNTIFEARGRKPIEAYVGGTAASAGFWISSAVDRISVDATARVGSVGVVVAMPKNNGEMIEIVNSASPNKRVDPEKEDGQKTIVSYLDAMADVFFSTLGRNFGLSSEYIKSNFGCGGIKVGADAVQSKMAHEVSSLQKVVSRLAAMDSTTRGSVTQVAIDLKSNEAVSEDSPVGTNEENSENDGGIMTKAEMKEKHPDLYALIVAEGKEGMVAATELADATKAASESKDAVKELSKSNMSLSAKLAGRIFDSAFAASEVPVSFKGKVEKQVDFKSFLDEKGVLDDDAYEKAVTAELKDWTEGFAANKTAIVGSGPVESSDIVDDKDDASDIDEASARMLKHLKV